MEHRTRAEFALTDTIATTLAALLGITIDEYRAAYNRARKIFGHGSLTRRSSAHA
ncbi:hypothetical protein [Mycobacterium haemophilum]